MYQNAATLAAVVLVYSAIAGRVARSWLSGPSFLLSPVRLGRLLHGSGAMLDYG